MKPTIPGIDYSQRDSVQVAMLPHEAIQHVLPAAPKAPYVARCSFLPFALIARMDTVSGHA
jgi:hypothetical protein